MNKKQLQLKRNTVSQKIRHSNRTGSHRNCVRISTGESLDHAIAKTIVTWYLMTQKKEVLTEAIFEGNNGRADVLCLDDDVAYEIIETEGDKSINRKQWKYPVDVYPIRITKDTEKNINKIISMLGIE